MSTSVSLCAQVNKYSIISRATLPIPWSPTLMDNHWMTYLPLCLMLVLHLSTTVLSWSFSWKWNLTMQMLLASPAFLYRKADRIWLQTMACLLLSLSFFINTWKGTAESGECAILITCTVLAAGIVRPAIYLGHQSENGYFKKKTIKNKTYVRRNRM